VRASHAFTAPASTVSATTSADAIRGIRDHAARRKSTSVQARHANTAAHARTLWASMNVAA